MLDFKRNDKVQDMLLIQYLIVFDVGSDKVEWAVCGKFVLKKRMCNHIGKHLVLKKIDPLPKNCGFCGMIGCSIELVILINVALVTPYSDFKNFEKINSGAAKIKWLSLIFCSIFFSDGGGHVNSSHKSKPG